jgi:D-lactate dehydrogenase
MVYIKAHTKEQRMSSLEEPYRQIYQDLARSIPAQRLITDPLRTLAFGTDASFYRLIPKLVVKAESEAEIVAVLRAANRHNLPVTFRAAGTSLSGQAVSDAILLIAAGGWQHHQVMDDGQRIRLQPGIIGARANRYLAPYGRKIGPDPASINAAMIGGILANNASGMCCGVAQNSYQTVESLRLILADGTLLDTADANSRQAFARTHGNLLARCQSLPKRSEVSPL